MQQGAGALFCGVQGVFECGQAQALRRGQQGGGKRSRVGKRAHLQGVLPLGLRVQNGRALQCQGGLCLRAAALQGGDGLAQAGQFCRAGGQCAGQVGGGHGRRHGQGRGGVTRAV